MFTLLLVTNSCANKEKTLVNTAHLDHLYDEVEIMGKKVGIIHIYSEYPDYKVVEAPGEGIACVDDVARAAVFYLRHYQYTGTKTSLAKAEKLLDFILLTQADNGYFYNFINSRHEIDSLINNSRPRADWWSWRALWVMGEAYPFYLNHNRSFADTLEKRIRKVTRNIDEFQRQYPKTVVVQNKELPTWLPYEYAADQAGTLLLGLIPYYRASGDTLAGKIIELQSRGVVMLQSGDSLTFPFGAFLSWKNHWHGWGNNQAYALLDAGDVLKEFDFKEAALRELDGFYPWLVDKGYLKSFSVGNDSGKDTPAEIQQFEQIAYAVRPMVFANIKAYIMTGDKRYSSQALEMTEWLLGKNIANAPLYDPETGRCFDGIDNSEKLNMNSGAESTIEALLTILEIEQHPDLRQELFAYYKKRNN